MSRLKNLDRDRVLGVLLMTALAVGAVYVVFQPGFLTYYFFGGAIHTPWWERAVWGNVWAVLPCSILAVLYGRAKLAAHRKEQREEHEEALALAKKHHLEIREHNAHVWKHVAAIHEYTTGHEAEPHPHQEAFDAVRAATQRS